MLRPSQIQQIYQTKDLYITSDHNNERISLISQKTGKVFLEHNLPSVSHFLSLSCQIALNDQLLVINNCLNIFLIQFCKNRRIVSTGEIDIKDEVKYFEVFNQNFLVVLTKKSKKLRSFVLGLNGGNKVIYTHKDDIVLEGNQEIGEEIPENFTICLEKEIACVHYSKNGLVSTFEIFKILKEKMEFEKYIICDISDENLNFFRSVRFHNNNVVSGNSNLISIAAVTVNKEDEDFCEFYDYVFNFENGIVTELVENRKEGILCSNPVKLIPEGNGFVCGGDDEVLARFEF